MEDKQTFQLVEDLRDFADFVEEHGPDLPKVTVELRSWIWGYDLANGEEDIPKAVALAMRAGMNSTHDVTKEYSDDYFRLYLKFGELQYKVVCNRDAVCVRNVIGSKTITQRVPPEGEWTEEIVKQDIVEWKCNPLLAIATDHE